MNLLSQPTRLRRGTVAALLLTTLGISASANAKYTKIADPPKSAESRFTKPAPANQQDVIRYLKWLAFANMAQIAVTPETMRPLVQGACLATLLSSQVAGRPGSLVHGTAGNFPGKDMRAPAFFTLDGWYAKIMTSDDDRYVSAVDGDTAHPALKMYKTPIAKMLFVDDRANWAQIGATSMFFGVVTPPPGVKANVQYSRNFCSDDASSVGKYLSALGPIDGQFNTLQVPLNTYAVKTNYGTDAATALKAATAKLKNSPIRTQANAGKNPVMYSQEVFLCKSPTFLKDEIIAIPPTDKGAKAAADLMTSANR